MLRSPGRQQGIETKSSGWVVLAARDRWLTQIFFRHAIEYSVAGLARRLRKSCDKPRCFHRQKRAEPRRGDENQRKRGPSMVLAPSAA